jgi:hypothetical protein
VNISNLVNEPVSLAVYLCVIVITTLSIKMMFLR